MENSSQLIFYTTSSKAMNVVEAETSKRLVMVNFLILFRGFMVLHTLVSVEVADVTNRIFFAHLFAEHVTFLMQLLCGF